MHIILSLVVTGFVLILSGLLAWARAKDRNRVLVLRLLLEHPDSYGLQLQGLSKGKLGMGVYPTLRLLEDEGLLSAREDHLNTASRGGRPRIRYMLTERGATEARRLIEGPAPA